MRTDGLVSTLSSTEPPDHVCWVYDDEDGPDRELDAALHAFLTAGLVRGERLLVVGERLIDALPGDLLALADSGALDTLTLAQAYEAAGEFTPAVQLAFYEARSRQALDAGYRGLRVAAEVSGLAGDPERLDRLTAWEQVADEFVVRGGMTALCAYRAELPDAARADALSVHPHGHPGRTTVPFRVFADGGAVAVSGSVDADSADRLARVLAAAPVTGPAAALDLGRLHFVDVAGARALAGWARAQTDRAARVEFRGGPRLLRRMWEVLGLGAVAAVSFTEPAA